MKVHQLKNAILQLAVQGKLVPQNPNDEPASKLLKRIAAEKRRRIKAGEIKKTNAIRLSSDAAPRSTKLQTQQNDASTTNCLSISQRAGNGRGWLTLSIIGGNVHHIPIFVILTLGRLIISIKHLIPMKQLYPPKLPRHEQGNSFVMEIFYMQQFAHISIICVSLIKSFHIRQ